MKKILSLIVISLMGVSAFAQEQGNAAASVSMPFIREGRNPASLAMGNTSMLETANTAYSVFGNVAATAFSDNLMDIGASYEKWGSDASKTNNITGGVGLNINSKFGITAGVAIDNGSASMTAEEQGVYGKDVKPTYMMVGAGFSYRFIPQLSAGVNVKYVSQKLSEYNPYSAVSADVLLMAKFSGFEVTGGVTSLGSKVKSQATDASFSLPTAATLAGGYKNNFGKTALDLRLEAEYYFHGAFRAAVGGAFSFADIVAIRAGYNYGGVVGNFASVGIGVKFAGVHLDAAYLLGNAPVGGTFCVGLGYSLPQKKQQNNNK